MKKFLKYAIVIAVLAAGVGSWIWNRVNIPYAQEESTWVYIPRGIGRDSLDATLRALLGERFGGAVMTAFKVAAKDSTDARGAYLIKEGDRAKDVARRLVRRRQTPVKVTFNNIRTRAQLSERVAAAMEFDAEEFDAAMNRVLPSAGFRPEEYIAAFLPDTYEFYWTAPAEDVVSKLLEHRNAFWNDERRAQAAALGLNPVKVATICSIAEEETNNAEERATVGRLYLNRVRKGMRLQADPTVKFAVGDFTLRRILGKHLAVESPYNTYKVSGLPPGPIRMPERRTMENFLSARDNDYLYMCAKEDFSGRHNFARDFATHQANARRYQQALNARGIK